MGMGASRRKRQVVLFVSAILLPAVVLIGLAARIIGQERELSGKPATAGAAYRYRTIAP